MSNGSVPTRLFDRERDTATRSTAFCLFLDLNLLFPHALLLFANLSLLLSNLRLLFLDLSLLLCALNRLLSSVVP